MAQNRTEPSTVTKELDSGAPSTPLGRTMSSGSSTSSSIAPPFSWSTLMGHIMSPPSSPSTRAEGNSTGGSQDHRPEDSPPGPGRAHHRQHQPSTPSPNQFTFTSDMINGWLYAKHIFATPMPQSVGPAYVSQGHINSVYFHQENNHYCGHKQQSEPSDKAPSVDQQQRNGASSSARSGNRNVDSDGRGSSENN